MTQPYAMIFEPILKEKVWGGRRLERFGKDLPGTALDGPRFGESWEIADLTTTSASGGGGGSAISVIVNGPLAGKTISDVVLGWGAKLLGDAGMERAITVGRQTGAGRAVFPLLVKYLDAAQHLSVQVHPSPAYVAAHPGAHLKSESWFVIDAVPETLPSGELLEPSVFVGLKAGLNEASLRASIVNGAVACALRSSTVRPGDCITLPSGTVHALGAGVLVAEVQTPSDTTFRVYDWASQYNRPERELHIEQAMECVDFVDASPLADTGGSDLDSDRRAAETEFYTIDTRSGEMAFTPGRMAVIMVHAGSGRLTNAGDDIDVEPGTTVLIPAACAKEARLEGDSSLRTLLIEIGE